jgi:hypothetical protein
MTEQDMGDADPRLTAALESGDLATIQSVVLEVRVLVPIVATGEEGTGAEMAVPRLVNEDGLHALPVFSSYDALRAWRPEGRPVPMTGAQAVEAAIKEGYDAVVLDVAGPISAAMPVAGERKPDKPADSPGTDPR